MSHFDTTFFRKTCHSLKFVPPPQALVCLKSYLMIVYFTILIGYKKLFFAYIVIDYISSYNLFTEIVRPPTGLFYRKRPPQRNRDRRKRHRTKCTGLRPCWRSLRHMHVPGHAGRSDVIMAPPPPNSTYTQAKISDFWVKQLKSMTASF